MNPLSMLHLQNKSYDPKIIEQAQDIFERISKAILKDLNFIEYPGPIYAVNRMVLMMKGYYLSDGKIVWNDYLSHTLGA
jgi:hypothetical protein